MRFVRPLEELRIRKEPLGCCNGTGLLGVDQRPQDDMNAYKFKSGELIMHFPAVKAHIKAKRIPGTSGFRCAFEPALGRDGGFMASWIVAEDEALCRSSPGTTWFP